jgi:two-component system OmpR family sensor kinase
MTSPRFNVLRFRLAIWCIAASCLLLFAQLALMLILTSARAWPMSEPLEAMWGPLLWSAGVSLPILSIGAVALGVFVSGLAVGPVTEVIHRLRTVRSGAPAARLSITGMTQELARLSEAVNDLLADAQRSQMKQARFATEAAHELRTPLTAQHVVGELALRGSPSPEMLREAVSSMLEQSEHMQNLVDSLLLVARAEGGMLGKPTTTIDASELAEAAVRSMQPLAEQKNQSLSVQAQDSRLVVAEAALLRQAVLNLVHNALVHTPRDTRIDVGVRANAEGEVVISVTDDGPGFAAYEPGQVVRRYSRREEDRSARAGLGLGMTIAQSLVHAQGGKMVVDSRPGFGTAIRLHFAASSSPLSHPPAVRFGRRRSDHAGPEALAQTRASAVLKARFEGNRRAG